MKKDRISFGYNVYTCIYREYENDEWLKIHKQHQQHENEYKKCEISFFLLIVRRKKKWNKLLGADHFEEEGMMMS